MTKSRFTGRMDPSPINSAERRRTGRIMLAGVLFTLLFALLSRGFYHPDEHFQILEYARLKLFGAETTDYMPWEYHAMMRPGIQPFIAWALGRLLLAAGLYTPFALVALLQLLSAALSSAVLIVLFRTVHEELGTECRRRWFLFTGFFLWCMAYLHVHFTAELFAGNLLVLLAALTLRSRQAAREREFRWGAALGLVAGLTFAVRYQAGFALAGYGIWLLIYDRHRRLFAGMVPGVCLALAAGLCADYWLYGEWTLVPLNYLRENILNSHMDEFGVSPWWYYFTEAFSESGYVTGAVLLAATVWFFVRRPRHVVTWMLLPFLFVHFLLGQRTALLFPGALLRALFPRALRRGVSAADFRRAGLALDGGCGRCGESLRLCLCRRHGTRRYGLPPHDERLLPRRVRGRGAGRDRRLEPLFLPATGQETLHGGCPVLHAAESHLAAHGFAGAARTDGTRAGGGRRTGRRAFGGSGAGGEVGVAASETLVEPLSRLDTPLVQLQRLDPVPGAEQERL